MKILFIDAQYVLDNSTINPNLEPKIITRSIMDAQYLHIQQTIGSKLYKRLETMIGDDSIASNSDYKTLLTDYIQPAVLQWTTFECIPYLRYKLMNKGVNTQNSENSETIEFAESKFFQDQIKNKAEFYSQRITEYLLANLTKYPEFNNGNIAIDDILPANNNYNCGFVLDDDIDNCKRALGLNR